MPRLVECPSCREHVKRSERICPHCDVVLVDERSVVTHMAGAVLVGLGLAGCPADDDDDNDDAMTNMTVEPEYGVPATESDSVSASSTMGMSSTTVGTTASTDDASTTDVGEPEYGSPETFTETGTETGTSGTSGDSTDGSTSIEPDYGVADSG